MNHHSRDSTQEASDAAAATDLQKQKKLLGEY
jgi:hypothetical protein